MKITKMHGIGNDYIYINGFSEQIGDPAGLARLVSDRHFGVGGDGLIIIQPPTSSAGDCRMEMYNADGSRAQMCGNGIRCVAKFVHDRKIVSSSEIQVETDAGMRDVKIQSDPSSPSTTMVEVGMGPPGFAQKDLPAHVHGSVEETAIEVPVKFGDLGTFTVTLVSMGNPHCVIRLDASQPIQVPLKEIPLEKIGPVFENHTAFPERINTEFIEILSPSEINFRVWERGSGETLACGTGACAAVVAGARGGWLDRQVKVHLIGGDLDIWWDEASDEVFMTGPATEVFSGELNLEWLREGGMG